MIRRVTMALLFAVGWISGGGIFAIATMLLLEAIGATSTNEWFVFGCLWGSGGVAVGIFMVKNAALAAKQGERHD